MSSIPPDSPWRGAAAFLRQPVSRTDEAAAQNLVETIYYFNCRDSNLPDIEYRSSEGDRDITHHVFRWDTTPYDLVFQNGFVSRRQERTPDSTFYNLEQYVNGGGRPLDSSGPTNYCFVSTTRSSSWHPSINSGSRILYRYEIFAPGGILVAQTLGDRYRFPGQDEIAFPCGIAPQYIRSAQMFRLTYTSHGHTSRARVDVILYLNMNFNPQSHPARILSINRPVFDYMNGSQRSLLKLRVIRSREKRSVGTNDALNEYYLSEKSGGVTDVDRYIDSAFRSSTGSEAYVFFRGEYVLMNYAPGSTDDKIINGPLFIGNGFPSLVSTAFAEYGIDAAFDCHDTNQAIIFSGKLCARINYAPGTTTDWIIEGPKTIKQMFPFFKGTNFEKGIDAAFKSTTSKEAYLFKGSEYALIDYSRRTLVAIRPITKGFECLRNTEFERDIGAAFASHVKNEAYLFKGNSYILLHFTPGKTEDYIVGGPKEVIPRNWPSLKDILPRKNRGLDVYEFDRENPEHDHDEL